MITVDQIEKNIEERIKWLKQKEISQRTIEKGSQLLIGRTQGEIGALTRLLGEIKNAK